MVEPKLKALLQRVIDSANDPDAPGARVRVNKVCLEALAGYVPPLSQKEYVDGNGLNCPYCHATSLMFDDDLALGGSLVTLRCECENCHMVWEERYELTGYATL